MRLAYTNEMSLSKLNLDSKAKALPKVQSRSSATCESSTVDIQSIKEDVVVQVPVVLTQLKINMSLDYRIEMPYSTSNIVESYNGLRIIKCHFIPRTNFIALKGFISKSTKYNTYYPPNIVGSKGYVKESSFSIPFEAEIEIICSRLLPSTEIESTSLEYEYMDETSNLEICDKRAGREAISFYNKKPFCNITGSKIINNTEDIIIKEILNSMRTLGTERKITIKNKMYIEINMEILQEKDVLIKNESNPKKSNN